MVLRLWGRAATAGGWWAAVRVVAGDFSINEGTATGASGGGEKGCAARAIMGGHGDWC